jgi:hypothetical protein
MNTRRIYNIKARRAGVFLQIQGIGDIWISLWFIVAPWLEKSKPC